LADLNVPPGGNVTNGLRHKVEASSKATTKAVSTKAL